MTESAFQGIVDFLRSHFGAHTQKSIASTLGLKQSQISLYVKKPPVRSSWWKKLAKLLYELGYEEGCRAGQTEAIRSLMAGLVKAFGQIPQAELAGALRISQPTISNWLRGNGIPSAANFERLLQLHVVKLVVPIVEFAEIHPIQNGNSWRLTREVARETGLRNELLARPGLYMFYDSAGRVTYVGKATNLWNEVKQRLRASVNRPFYCPSKKARIQQGVVARYLSAYEIRVPAATHNLEALMLRAFPNDLANINRGHFKDGL